MNSYLTKVRKKKVVTVRGFGEHFESIYDVEKQIFIVYKITHEFDCNGYPTDHRNRIGITEDFREAVLMIANAM